ncbi:ATPase [Aureococcus anophagefferens]|nr:ATPase [Aureococcus anophagefferens]
MDAAKAKELKKYTRELLRDHETLSRNLAAAEALAAERQAELDKLQAQAERAPEAGGNNYLFGELCRVKERAQQSEVEARRLSVKLDVARTCRRRRARLATAARMPQTHLSFERPATYESQRPATFCRARSPRPSRASGAALLWRSTASRTRPGGGAARAESANRRVDDERRRLLEALEAAADAARRAHRGAAYRNGDGAALRSSRPSRPLRHRVARSDGASAPFCWMPRACSRLEERRDAQDAVLVACAKAKDAAAAWLETIGWARAPRLAGAAEPVRPRLRAAVSVRRGGARSGRPRAPCSTTKAARCSSTPVGARRDAVAALEAAGVAFQLRHARHAVERLRDAAAPAAAAAEAPEVDDEAAYGDGPSRRGPGPRVRAVRAHGPVAHGVQRRAAAGGVAVTARARGAAAPGARRPRPRRSTLPPRRGGPSRSTAWAPRAALQLADAASFGDLEEAVRRVFGDDGAPTSSSS